MRASLAARACVSMVRGYQRYLSPLMGGNCRFYPTCSEYARQALLAHGFWRGSGLAVSRVLRCHPYAKGGVEEVPARRDSRQAGRD